MSATPTITRIKSKKTGTEYPVSVPGFETAIEQAAGHASAAGLAVEGARSAANAVLDEAQRVIGYTSVPVFSSSENYAENTRVKRLEQDGKYHYYRFTEYHSAGIWTGNDAVEISVFSEIDNILGTDNEKVHLTVITYDGQSTEGIQISVTLTETGDIEHYTLDENGCAEFTIPKQKLYTISFPDELNYRSIPDYSFKALAHDRYLQVEYKDPNTDYEVIKVTAIMEDMSGAKISDATELAKLIGQPVALVVDGDSTTYSQLLDSNLQCEFELEYGKHYTISVPNADGYSINHHSVQHTSAIAERNISFLYHLESTEIVALDANGNSYDYETLAAMTQEERTALGIRAILISNSVLAQNNASFMVKYPLAISSKAWLNQNTELGSNVLPMYTSESGFHGNGVTKCGYDGWWRGETNTENILDLAHDAGYTAAAAAQAAGETLTIAGQTVSGYLGAAGEWQQWRAVREAFYALYFLLAGSTPTLLTSGDYWSSSQYNAINAWHLSNGSWCNCSKASSLKVVAFFRPISSQSE